MNDELTNEQINRGLAKWHSEKHKYAMKFTAGVCLDATSECGTCFTFPLYTVSLDTMRLIEALMTLEQQKEYAQEIKALHCWTWDQSAFWIISATARQRARAAFTVLGLKIEEDCAITVSARDFETLVERIENPAPPSTFLKEMMTKYPRKTKPPAAILGETNE